MIKLWIAASVVACAAGLAALRWRRAKQAPDYSTEPLSGEWLSEARAHEEHTW